MGGETPVAGPGSRAEGIEKAMLLFLSFDQDPGRRTLLALGLSETEYFVTHSGSGTLVQPASDESQNIRCTSTRIQYSARSDLQLVILDDPRRGSWEDSIDQLACASFYISESIRMP
jgi:hypothetical protein